MRRHLPSESVQLYAHYRPQCELCSPRANSRRGVVLSAPRSFWWAGLFSPTPKARNTSAPRQSLLASPCGLPIHRDAARSPTGGRRRPCWGCPHFQQAASEHCGSAGFDDALDFLQVQKSEDFVKASAFVGVSYTTHTRSPLVVVSYNTCDITHLSRSRVSRVRSPRVGTPTH